MWFGPRGFASVVYGPLVLESAIVASDEQFHLIARVVVASILAHWSTLGRSWWIEVTDDSAVSVAVVTS